MSERGSEREGGRERRRRLTATATCLLSVASSATIYLSSVGEMNDGWDVSGRVELRNFPSFPRHFDTRHDSKRTGTYLSSPSCDNQTSDSCPIYSKLLIKPPGRGSREPKYKNERVNMRHTSAPIMLMFCSTGFEVVWSPMTVSAGPAW